MAERVPVVEGLFVETPDGPRLLGSRCVACGTPYFPRVATCHHPQCEGGKIEEVAFGPRGRLWSWTVQDRPPPPPARYEEPFRPYLLGAVDLPEGLRVVSRIDAPNPGGLAIDMEVELALGRLGFDEEGRELVTWIFRPVAAGARA